jgi:long-chain acyl-CoA synthetase
MPRETLADLFADLGRARGDFLVHDNGFRTWTHTYREAAAAAEAYAARLQAAGFRRGDAVLFWSENRPEWIAAFWACALLGVVVVPLDHRSPPDLAGRVAAKVLAKGILLGDDVAATLEGHARDIPAWQLADLDWTARSRPVLDRQPLPDDVVEVIFTSGATAEPKGVIITHRNVMANVVPVEREILKYRKWGRPFFPLRFLNLLPLSHMFGQALATFIPPMLPGTVVFVRGFNPAEIVAQVHRRRISVIALVPKVLEVLREYVVRRFPETAVPPPAGEHVARRWWRYRAVHRAFGLKCWCFVVGAAPLDPALEAFWGGLGFLVVQGYGLTETAPIVSLNHPFAARRGSVGKAIAGVEVRIAADGEILVRGDNVTRGYFGQDAAEAGMFEDGWLRTGDIGEMDEDGRLFVRGRKKEMIVTPEGLNVFPEDVERVLDRIPGVRESAVVASPGGAERVHAVLVTGPGVDPEAVVREANERLADHQKIRGVAVWPEPALPRTEGTGKLKRRAVRDWLATGAAVTGPRPAEGVAGLLSRYAHGRPLAPDTTIEELGLSSLERVELMVALEERAQGPLDEGRFARARTLGDLESLARQPPDADAAADWEMPSWNRSAPARLFRRVNLAAWVLPAVRVLARAEVRGLEHLVPVRGPVVYAANHQSHLDTPLILAALPGRLRWRVAVAMAKEYFAPYFHAAGGARWDRFSSGVLYGLAALFFNAFPIPQREAGARRTLRYVGDLAAEDHSLLVFPEGRRTDGGEIRRFKPGVGMIASRLRLPVVPVRLEGVERVLHRTWWMIRPGRVTVSFGEPLVLGGDDYEALAARVERAVRDLGGGKEGQP